MAISRRTIVVICFFTLFSFSSQAHATRSTKIESFTDPDYIGYQPKNVVLMVSNGSFETTSKIEEKTIKKFAERGVTVFPYRKLFPPTRSWSNEAQSLILEKNQIDSGLFIAVGARASQLIPIATQTYGSSTVSGNFSQSGAMNAYGRSNSTSYNIFGAKSKAEFSAVLIDIKNNRTVWYADMLVKASGTLFVGEKGDAKGAAKAIIKGLEDSGHLAK